MGAARRPASAPGSPRRAGLGMLAVRLSLVRSALAIGVAVWLVLVALFYRYSLSLPQFANSFCSIRDSVRSATASWVADVSAEYSSTLAEIDALRAQRAELAQEHGWQGGPIIAHGGLQQVANLSEPFLFVAVLSTANSSRRSAVRSTWIQSAPSDVLVKFVLSEEEKTEAAEAEANAHGDMIFVRRGSGTGYRSIVFKIYLLVEWTVANVNARFVLKTDDDAYVDAAKLAAELRSLCRNPDCVDEKLYMGEEKRNGEVIVEEGHKWSNEEYFRLTGLKEYAPYMFGGGYIFSMDVAKALVQVNSIAPLKFMPNEDSTFGFWVMNMDLRKVDHPRVRTAAGHCCYTALTENEGAGRWKRFAVRSLESVCADWLILHKVDTDDQMRYIHERLKQCPQVKAIQERARAIGRKRNRVSPPLAPLETRRVSSPDEGYHFSGLHELNPWSPGGALLLVLQTDMTPQVLHTSDEVQIGIVNITNVQYKAAFKAWAQPEWQWQYLDSSKAWNFQIGPAAQWLGASQRYLIFNDRQCNPHAPHDELCSVVYDVQERQRKHWYRYPVWAVAADGKRAITFDFFRLHKGESGFGYPYDSTMGALLDTSASDADGLYIMDLTSGERTMIVSYRALFDFVTHGPGSTKYDKRSGHMFFPRPLMKDYLARKCVHWINHAQWNKEGNSIVFLYRVGLCKGGALANEQNTYVFTIDADGGNLWRLPVVQGGRHSYGSNGILALCDASGFYIVQNQQEVRLMALNERPNYLGDDKNDAETQCVLCPVDNRFMLVDRYTGWSRHLYVWDLVANDTLTLGYLSGRLWDGPKQTYAGLRPRWSSDGRLITFDSAHSWGYGSQMYMTGVQILQAGYPTKQQLAAAGPNRQRRLYIIAALREESQIEAVLAAAPAGQDVEVHCFEVGALNVGAREQLSLYLSAYNLTHRVTLHEQALHTEHEMITVNDRGVSTLDADVHDIATVLVAPDPGQSEKISAWLPRFEASWAPWRLANSRPQVTFEEPGVEVQVQGIDFSEWLRGTVSEEDYVTLQLDVCGREHALLSRLLMHETLLLVDRLEISWHMQHMNWEWPLMWEGIFALLDLDFAATAAPLPRPMSYDGNYEIGDDGGDPGGDTAGSTDGAGGEGHVQAGEAVDGSGQAGEAVDRSGQAGEAVDSSGDAEASGRKSDASDGEGADGEQGAAQREAAALFDRERIQRLQQAHLR